MMNKTITVNQLKELLEIQKKFDDRIPTLNLEDSRIAFVVEFFEWYNTKEVFKNWKAKPGKPLEVQLDELADILAFGLSIFNQMDKKVDESVITINIVLGTETNNKMLSLDKDNLDMLYGLPRIILHDEYLNELHYTVLTIPFGIANNYYSIDQLIAAYKKKMKRNHERQNGTVDKDKGYV